MVCFFFRILCEDEWAKMTVFWFLFCKGMTPRFPLEGSDKSKVVCLFGKMGNCEVVKQKKLNNTLLSRKYSQNWRLSHLVITIKPLTCEA
jgi:hypothetical protein